MSPSTPVGTGLRDVGLRCQECGEEQPATEVLYRCPRCQGTLDVVHDLEGMRGKLELSRFDARLGSREPTDRSGVWRFREIVLPLDGAAIVTRGEGGTHLYDSPQLARFAGVDQLHLKHEGENPTGSFKDRGMTVGVSVARALGMTRVACASTGNTSASMASYAAIAGMEALVFVPDGNVALGKLSQALAYGARTIQIAGDFDAAMTLVQEVCARERIYLLNSVNPFRVEGQKAIAFELLQDLGWQLPDWIVLPGGNLGNTAAIGKGLRELLGLGLIGSLPRIAVVQAEGANPLYRAFAAGHEVLEPAPARTLATAIKIGKPVSWRRAFRELRKLRGVVSQASDQEIMDAKAAVDAAGIGAEPASCAAVAGLKKLVAAGTVRPGERVCAILTGHLLKDPDSVVGYHRGELPGIRSEQANAPLNVHASLEAILEVVRSPRGIR